MDGGGANIDSGKDERIDDSMMDGRRKVLLLQPGIDTRIRTREKHNKLRGMEYSRQERNN